MPVEAVGVLGVIYLVFQAPNTLFGGPSNLVNRPLSPRASPMLSFHLQVPSLFPHTYVCAKTGYVILNYFPVCLKCTHKPQTPYNTVGGQNVEKVLPYNTITKAGGATEQGPENKWVDTDHHFKKVKSRTAGKSLTKKNWDVSMSHVHKVGSLWVLLVEQQVPV